MYTNLLYFYLTVLFRFTRADIFMECEDVPDETFVLSWESCQSYVYCMGDDSMLGNCDEGEYFDPESGSCDLAANVQCFLDEPAEESGEDDPEEKEPDLTEEVPEKLDILNVKPLVKPSCPISDDPSQVIFMASNESCSNYFLCYHGHAMQMHCTNQLQFNVNIGQCDHPENVNCPLDTANAHKCLPHMTDFFPHPEKCSYFYYCIKGFLTLQQCPFYYGWDIERKSCVQMHVAKCYGNAKHF